ncbi:preprotein translocase subunit SecE [Mesonia maritima]|jgi:preprotein translocase subunit SecE|uniref:Protein translocase subunit SecE n=1 Tax=Mesonia maritima TaxID=1793873 RepID=A0ABU1K6E2_9FLAO|nr:preprotein translocase subunit SecE [Mesonia maritima]MDR6301178.1 preprotein translocase subunit SecE [Mesonia maritima]
MAGIVNYISQSYDELKNHVTWPSFAEAQRLSVLVLVFSIIFSLAIWGVDTVFGELVEEYFIWVKS